MTFITVTQSLKDSKVEFAFSKGEGPGVAYHFRNLWPWASRPRLDKGTNISIPFTIIKKSLDNSKSKFFQYLISVIWPHTQNNFQMSQFEESQCHSLKSFAGRMSQYQKAHCHCLLSCKEKMSQFEKFLVAVYSTNCDIFNDNCKCHSLKSYNVSV